MRRSFLFSLGWIRVQVLIDASFDFVYFVYMYIYSVVFPPQGWDYMVSA